jgi:hypothetical protein
MKALKIERREPPDASCNPWPSLLQFLQYRPLYYGEVTCIQLYGDASRVGIAL